jgi:hypothetical protein
MIFVKGGIIIFILFIWVSTVNAQTLLDINFISQVPPGQWADTLNCGQTSYLMIDSQIKGYLPTPDMIKDIDDWLFERYGDPIREYSGSVTTVYKLKTLAQEYGKYQSNNVIISTESDIQTLKKVIDEQKLIIVAVYTDMGLRPKSRGHFMIVTGYDDTHFYFNDPGKTLGKNNKYRIEDFVAAWSRQNYSHIIFTQPESSTQFDIQKNLEVDPALIVGTVPDSSQTMSIFSRVKSFFSHIFSTHTVEGEVLNPPRQIAEPTAQTSIVAPTVIPETNSPMFDASILPIERIRIQKNDREALVTVRARNTGNQTWVRSAVSLNVVGGRTLNAPYRHSSWITDLRPTALDQERVAPGDIGTFTMLVRIPVDESTITFRTQLVRQDNGQFFQIGSTFATAMIDRVSDIIEIDSPGTSDADVNVTPKAGIIRQIQEVITDVTKGIQDSISNTIDTIIDTTKFLFGSTSPRRTGDSSVEPEVPLLPYIQVVFPDSNPYIAASSTFEMGGTINNMVQDVYVQTTASGTLSFSLTSLTWQWIGTLQAGTTTFDIIATDGQITSEPRSLVVYFAPTYTLEAPSIDNPTSSDIWHTNSTETQIGGTVDARATSIIYTSSDTNGTISPSSSRWGHVVTSNIEGSTEYRYQGIDAFGNSSATTSLHIVYDQTPPQITTSTYDRTSTTLSFDTLAIDTLSSVALYEWHIALADTHVTPCVASTTIPFDDIEQLSDPCVWGVVTSTIGTEFVVLKEVFREQDLVVRVRAIDLAQNSSDWLYQHIPYVASQSDGPQYALIKNALITEIAWMGTKASTADEWIEIVIIGEDVVDVHNWVLVWGNYTTELGKYANEFILTRHGMNPDEPLYIPPGYPTLFERTDDTTISDIDNSFIYTGALPNTGTYIAILNANREIVDEIDNTGGWFAGNNTTKATMMRRTIGGDSNDPANWCTYTDCTPADFLWAPQRGIDSQGNAILGTPGGPAFGMPILEF